MTRSELIEALSQHMPHMTLQESDMYVTYFLDQITDALSNGHRVEMRGFGVFSMRQRHPRQGRNPRTGEHVTIQAKSVPFFKAGKELLKKLNASNL